MERLHRTPHASPPLGGGRWKKADVVATFGQPSGPLWKTADLSILSDSYTTSPMSEPSHDLHALPQIGRRSVRVLTGALLGMVLALGAGAQSGGGSAAATVSGQQILNPNQIGFQMLRDGQFVRCVVEQDRVVRLPDSTPLGYRERLTFEGGEAGRFALELVDVLGKEALAQHELLQRREAFLRHAGFIERFHSFRVFDIAAAQQNYEVHYIQAGQHLGRPTSWLVVLPKNADRSAWLLQIDQATGFPFYRGEYSSGGVLCSEVIVRSAALGAQAQIGSNVPWWAPVGFDIKDFATAEDAILASGNPAAFVPEIGNSAPGYGLDICRITTNLLDATKTLVFGFSDGIDHMFLTERARPDIAPVDPNGEMHVIKVFSDIGVTECEFSHNRTQCLVVGRGNKDTIKAACKQFYLQVVQKR